MFLVPLMKPVTKLKTQQQNEKDHKDNNEPNNSVQQPAPSFNETNINTLCSCQHLAPEITADTTSLNTTTEISPILPTDIQSPIAANNLNDTSNFTQKSMLRIEDQLSVLKSYVDCELSTLTSKIDAFSDSLKHANQIFKKQKLIILTLTFFSKTLHPWKTN